MILQIHPTGNAYTRQSLQALIEAELLTEFWTCIDWKPDSLLGKVLPGGLKKQLERRTFPETGGKIHTRPWREMARLLALRQGWGELTKHEVGRYSVDQVFQDLDRLVAKRVSQLPQLRGVYGGEDGALQVLKAARERNLITFYDLPIGYWRAAHAIYKEESEREPEWAATLEGTKDSTAKLERKDAELELADIVFAASTFTRKTLELAPNSPRVVTVPYGSPPVVDEKVLDEWRPGSKLRVLFVGSLGQRKGTSYLLRAVEQLESQVELTLIGAKPAGKCAPLDKALAKYNWIPSLPHSEILEAMRRHDVFVFPSLFEGFGLVLLEAMSQGVPIIATPHTAGPDIISEGTDGFVVPIRSVEAITEKLSLLAENPQLLRDMRYAARRKAIERDWRIYRETQAQIIRGEIEKRQ